MELIKNMQIEYPDNSLHDADCYKFAKAKLETGEIVYYIEYKDYKNRSQNDFIDSYTIVTLNNGIWHKTDRHIDYNILANHTIEELPLNNLNVSQLRFQKSIVSEYNFIPNREASYGEQQATISDMIKDYEAEKKVNQDKAKEPPLFVETQTGPQISKIDPPNNFEISKSNNDAIIQELENYLDTLAKKISNYRGTSNLPIKQTNQIGDKIWVVLEEDLKECNTIIEIMKLLSKKSDNMVNVWNNVNVPMEDVQKFKMLANATNYYQNKVPKINANEAKMSEINNRLKEITKAQTSSDSGVTSQRNEEEYNILTKMYSYLEASKTQTQLVDYNGIKIGKEYLKQYSTLESKLQNIKNYKAYEKYCSDFSAYTKFVAEFKVNELNEQNDQLLKNWLDTIASLKDIIMCLKKSMNLETATNLIKIDEYYEEVYICESDIKKYKKARTDYDHLCEQAVNYIMKQRFQEQKSKKEQNISSEFNVEATEQVQENNYGISR